MQTCMRLKSIMVVLGSDADMHEAVINYRAGLMSTVPGLSFECCSKGYCAVQYFFNGWDQKLRR